MQFRVKGLDGVQEYIAQFRRVLLVRLVRFIACVKDLVCDDIRRPIVGGRVGCPAAIRIDSQLRFPRRIVELVQQRQDVRRDRAWLHPAQSVRKQQLTRAAFAESVVRPQVNGRQIVRNDNCVRLAT